PARSWPPEGWLAQREGRERPRSPAVRPRQSLGEHLAPADQNFAGIAHIHAADDFFAIPVDMNLGFCLPSSGGEILMENSLAPLVGTGPSGESGPAAASTGRNSLSSSGGRVGWVSAGWWMKGGTVPALSGTKIVSS
ncbi:hypothetical protein, partial [Verrucomicrobium spinosum]|uniref:hypothetical protein n=1 Tax=Verrucomicrobium spinosum TaxID=2736 RepID=UPI001C461A5B